LPEAVWFESRRQSDLLQLDVVVRFSLGGKHTDQAVLITNGQLARADVARIDEETSGRRDRCD
jgi:hypothetical protein